MMRIPLARRLQSSPLWALLVFCMLPAMAARAQPRPWWDSYPLNVDSPDVKTVQDYNGDSGFDTSLCDEHWGIYEQKTIGGTWTVSAMHNAGLKFLTYYTTGSWTSFILELGNRGNLDYTPVYRFFWSWPLLDTHGGPIAWTGPQTYFDVEDFCGPYNRLNPVYGAGGRAMTYPDGSPATGYVNNDSSDPRNSYVLDAGSSKDILGGWGGLMSYSDVVTTDPLRSGGLINVNEQNQQVGCFSSGLDPACPMWNDMVHSSVLYGTDNGMDGIWSDNYGPWCTFGYPPVQVAFGDWSVAGFRAYLRQNFTDAQLTAMGISPAGLSTYDVRTVLRAKLRNPPPFGLGGTDTNLNDPKWNDASWLNDPLWRAFKIYKRQVGSQGLSDYYQACKSAAAQMGKPDFYVSGNDIPLYALGYPRGTLDQVHAEMTPGWHMGSGSRGIMLPPVGRFAPVYKLAREYGQSRMVNITYYFDDQFGPDNLFNKYKENPGVVSTLYYEMLANQTLPMVHINSGYAPRTTQSKAINAPFFGFVKEARKTFAGRDLAQDIGVYYSSSSLIAYMTPAGFLDMDAQQHQFGFWGWTTALGNLHYQYRVIPEWKLTSDTLKSLRVLVIPNSEVFDSADVTGILSPWVNAGGRLIVTGNSGSRMGEAGNFTTTTTLTLAPLTGVGNASGAPATKLSSVGAGKVYFINANIGLNYYNTSTTTTRAALIGQFQDAMGQVLGSQPTLLTPVLAIPDTVGLTVYEDAGLRRLFVDANNLDLNLASDVVTPAPETQFQVALPDWLKGVSQDQLRVRVLSPDAAPAASLSLVGTDQVQIDLGSFTHYASVVIEGPNQAAGWQRYQ